MVKRVCLVSSGTGGHLMPAMVLARALRGAGHETVLLTEGRAVEQDMLAGHGCPVTTLPVGGAGPGSLLRLARALRSARRLFRQRRVDLVVGCGGRTSIPAGLAARSLGLPLCLLEQNAVAGRANRLLMRWAKRIYLGLPPAGRHARKLRRPLLTGTPLRAGLGDLPKTTARSSLGLDPAWPVLLVTGGSQGAEVLNRLVPEALGCLTGAAMGAAIGRAMKIQVLHLAGKGRDADVRLRYRQANNQDPEKILDRVVDMALDMTTMYAAADLVICRGGGGTVSELMATGRPAIIVPYPHHRDHQQWHNGHVLEAAGAALVRDEAELDAGGLAQLISDLLRVPERLRDMGRRARCMAPEDPCGRILEDLTSLGALD
ncbi:MAG: UDP-N-acetylglucosamine--N-acetylmuramyl-(pentapeptide) pyrophosphoryl-undecaprenol N-acetylglucosamine transferase [Planctomycetota bacterium]